jgi:hypothetical protein
MKKLLIFITVFFAGLITKAQTITFVPSSFTAEDQVTFTVDVTGTGMAGATEAYLWIFSNPDLTGGNDGITNGSWTNSSDAAKMTAAGTNKWKYTMTGTTMFGRSPAELKSFGFLLKKKDGSAQTPDYKPFFFDPLVFVPTMLRIFPSKVGSDDVITLNFDKTYGVSVNEQRMNPTTVTITVFDDLSNQVGTPLTIPVTNKTGTIWSGSFIPSMSFTPAAGRKLNKFKYKFNGTLLDPGGVTTTVSSSETEVTFTVMQ